MTIRRLTHLAVLALSLTLLLSTAARADSVQRDTYVSAGGYQTLVKLWNASAGAEFRCPAGAKVRVLYGYGWLSKSRQNQTLDCSTPKRVSVGAWAKLGARIQIKVPESGWVTWWYLVDGPS